MTTLSVGDKAPDFTLPSDGDGEIKLSDYKGKNVVIFFYPKDNTPGCTKEACEFRDNLSALQSSDTQVIGISKDSVKSHDKFKTKHELNFPLGADEDLKVNEAYGVWVEKSLYGKKYMGTERTTILIDKVGKIARIWSKVKVKGHVAEVLEAVKEL
jgi:peroxiredoxin Q/BCP